MRRRGPWLVFGAALLVLLGVMAGITGRLLDLEGERVAAEQRSAHQEQVRLALWQLDTVLAPLLSQEIAAVAALTQTPDAADRLPRPPEIRARFVLPREGDLKVLVSADDTTTTTLRGLLDTEDLWAAAPPPSTGSNDRLRLDNPSTSSASLRRKIRKSRPSSGSSFFGSAQQAYRDVTELSNRAKAVDRNVATYQSSLTALDPLPVGRDDSAARQGGPARPTWVEGELVVVRQVELDGLTALHGSWLDWPRLRDRLRVEIGDLLPDARLVPTKADTDDDVHHLLATLPVRLEPGSPPAVTTKAWIALAPSLLLGWLGTLAAALAVFAVLRWSLALSERRAAFVSAVTHELRTPLTTFRMYAEMLGEGMVAPAKRDHYVATLRREADRLGELVENVLAYSRIESERAPLAGQVLGISELLASVTGRLQERCDAAQLELRVQVPPEVSEVPVRVDPAAVEQILFNLVDNAAKYAPSRQAPHVELGGALAPRGRIALWVRDHGPGIDPAEHKSIFEPFAKARAHASGTKPGVGLGLALCRRLARQLGGDLRVEAANPGARFVLTMPRAPSS
ncbi:MAG: HAMP domain-containing sensor histidine kinase [Myxococcota bacterium]